VISGCWWNLRLACAVLARLTRAYSLRRGPGLFAWAGAGAFAGRGASGGAAGTPRFGHGFGALVATVVVTAGAHCVLLMHVVVAAVAFVGAGETAAGQAATRGSRSIAAAGGLVVRLARQQFIVS